MRSVVPTAGEKNKAGAVIEALVLSKCCSSVDRTFLMNELLKIADVSNNSGTGKLLIIIDIINKLKFNKNF